MKCPYCEHDDPEVSILQQGEVVIHGEGELSTLSRKADVLVECHHCGEVFMVQFEVQPAGILIDLS